MDRDADTALAKLLRNNAKMCIQLTFRRRESSDDKKDNHIKVLLNRFHLIDHTQRISFIVNHNAGFTLSCGLTGPAM